MFVRSKFNLVRYWLKFLATPCYLLRSPFQNFQQAPSFFLHGSPPPSRNYHVFTNTRSKISQSLWKPLQWGSCTFFSQLLCKLWLVNLPGHISLFGTLKFEYVVVEKKSLLTFDSFLTFMKNKCIASHSIFFHDSDMYFGP